MYVCVQTSLSIYPSLYLSIYRSKHTSTCISAPQACVAQPEPRTRLAVRGVPKGALRTHSAEQAPLWGSLVTCVVYCVRVRQC